MSKRLKKGRDATAAAPDDDADSPRHPVNQPTQPKRLEDPLWERQNGESSEAWEAWVYYRDNPPEETTPGDPESIEETKRSYTKVARRLKKSVTMVARWASVWQWQTRLIAWETFLDRERMREDREARIRMIERQREIGRGLQVLVYRNLERFFQNPNLIMELTPTEMSRLVEVGVKVERLSYGESTETIEQTSAREKAEQNLRNAQKAFRDSKLFMKDTPKEKRRALCAATYGVDESQLLDEDD